MTLAFLCISSVLFFVLCIMDSAIGTTFLHKINQSINQSTINRSINQQSIDQSINNQSINQSTNHPSKCNEYNLSVATIVRLLLVTDERYNFIISRTVRGVPCGGAGLVPVSTLVNSCYIINAFLSLVFAACTGDHERERRVDGKQCS